MSNVKYGRLPATIPTAVHDLTYYVAGRLPAAPASVDPPAITDWGMLGNDEWGDCGVAGIDHGFMAVDADLKESVLATPATDVVNYYLNYTGGSDVGVVLSQFLAYVDENGYYDRTISAYAPVSVRDLNTLHFAINAYDFAYAGITVYQGMEDAFGAGEPWDLHSISGNVAGGHCVPIVAYDSTWLYCVTWGKIQPIAYPAWTRVGDESWAIITGEEEKAGTAGHGINIDALKADLKRLKR